MNQDEVIRIRTELDDKATTKLSGIKKALGVAFGAASVAMLANFTIKMIKLSSAAEETNSKFNVVFRSVKGVNEQIAELAEKTGFATSTLKKMTSELGDFLIPMGFAREEAFKLSKEITQLSLDLASFNNVTNEEVLDAFKSAMSGMSRPLLRFGIDVRESALAQEAFNMKLIDNVEAYNKLDAQTKRSVRARSLMSKATKDSADAIGDLERTSTNYANVQRRLNERLLQMQELIGNKLLPIITPFLDKLSLTIEGINVLLKGSGQEVTELQKQANLLLQYAAALEKGQRTFLDPKDYEKMVELLKDENGEIDNSIENIKRVANERLYYNDVIENFVKWENENIDQLRAESDIVKDLRSDWKIYTDNVNNLTDAEKKRLEVIKDQLKILHEVEGIQSEMVESKEFSDSERQARDNEYLQEQYNLRNEIAQNASDEFNRIGEETWQKSLESAKVYGDAELEYAKNLLEKHKLLEEKKKEIQDQMIDYNTNLVGSFADLFRAFGQQSKAAFDAYKAFAIAETIISTYSAAQKQFTALSLFPPAAYAAAAAAVVSGLARVAMISQQEYQGRQFGGEVQAGVPYTVGEQGREVFISNLDGYIIPNRLINKMGGGQVINVNAVMDAEAFKMLLRSGGNKVLQSEIS
ncbi:MAG: hypothetical protein KJ941_09640, partial [Bacteroidetes bacterium]|nr:hypothetical protein [Bacteroidota bacterium]